MGACMSSYAKLMSSFFRRSDWPVEREKLVNILHGLGEQESTLTKQDIELYHQINTLKNEANLLAKNVSSRPQRKPTANEEVMMKSLMRKINLLEREKHLKAQNLTLFNQHVSSISTLIVQKDTVHQMKTSVQAVHDIGIDIEGMEQTIENTANTSDQLDQMSSTMADKLADAAMIGGEYSSSFVFGAGVPFHEVATYGETVSYASSSSNNNNISEWNSESKAFEKLHHDNAIDAKHIMNYAVKMQQQYV